MMEAAMDSAVVHPVPSARRVLRRAAAWILALPLLWWGVGALLAADRGIDLTDESLYLLDADPPNRHDAFGFPYGWITAPMFRVVGMDIARLRTLAGVVLVLATALLMHHVLRFAATRSAGRTWPGDDAPAHRWIVALSAGTGLLFYVGLPMLRTPSYNWLNLVGISVGLAGVFLASRGTAPSTTGGPTDTRAAVMAGALIATGMFLALHAKPTTPFLVALGSAPLLVRARGTRGALTVYGWSVAIGTAIVAVAWVSPLWPADPIAPFLRAVRIPSLSVGHDPLSALMLLLLSPVELARRALLGQPHWLVGPLLVSLLTPPIARTSFARALATPAGRLLAVAPLLAGAFAIVAPEAVVGWIHGGGLGPLSDRLMPGRLDWPIEGYLAGWSGPVAVVGWLATVPASASIMRAGTMGTRRIAAGLLLMLGTISSGALLPFGVGGAGPIVGLAQIGAAAWILEGTVPRAGLAAAGRRLEQVGGRWAAVAAILAGIGAYAFGHDTGPVNAMPAAAGLGVGAAILLLATGPFATRRVLLSTTALLLAVTLLGIAAAREAPYRSAPIAAQTVAVPLGPHGATLRLEPGLADLLGSMRSAADGAGWERGQQLYGLHVTWSTGLTYALAGQAPPSLQPTAALRTRGLERLRFNLQNDDLEGWDAAWLLLPDFALLPEDGIDADELDAAREAVRLFGERVGSVWPDDYELVWTAPLDAPLAPHTRVTLWKPQEPRER
jgi:hypothetical protein